jgi:hypothetical protein
MSENQRRCVDRVQSTSVPRLRGLAMGRGLTVARTSVLFVIELMTLLHPPPLPDMRDATILHGLVRLIGLIIRAPGARRGAAKALRRAKRLERLGRTEDAYRETQLALEMLDEKVAEYWSPFVFPFRTEATFELARLAHELRYPVPHARLREHCEALRIACSHVNDPSMYAKEIAFLEAQLEGPVPE